MIAARKIAELEAPSDRRNDFDLDVAGALNWLLVENLERYNPRMEW